MASNPINIADMREAIADGTLPGSFTPDRTAFEFPTLLYEGARGAQRTWTIKTTLLRRAADSALEPVPIVDSMLAPAGLLPPDHLAENRNESGQVGGKIRDIIPTYVTEGKRLGQKNATNALTQALRDALGLYNKQLRKANSSGMADTTAADGAQVVGTNVAGAKPAGAYDQRPPPQLIKPAADAPLTAADFESGVTVQRKLNGVRFVAAAGSAGAADAAPTVIRYSRSALDYPGQNAIAEELAYMFAAWAARLADSAPFANAALEAERASGALSHLYLDGELYKHGEGLNQISGQARRPDAAGDPSLNYHIFDAFLPMAKAAGRDMPSRDRQSLVDEFFNAAAASAAVSAAASAAGAAASAAGADAPFAHIKRVTNSPAADQAAVDALAAAYLAEGYEGAIARRDAAGYRYSHNGYHSANALKIKPTHDAEFTVVGFAQGGRGKEVGAVIWVCEVPADRAINPADRTFTVTPKNMTYAERYKIYGCLGVNVAAAHQPPVTRFERDVLGKPLTVEYKELSPTTGKPLQAKALAFRTYESGPDADPIARLMRECV
jgi:hypothetical protein